MTATGKQSGSVLIWVLVLTTLGMGILAAVNQLAPSNYRRGLFEKSYTLALYAAESGINYAYAWVRNGHSLEDCLDTLSESARADWCSKQDEYRITVTDQTSTLNGYLIIVEGYRGGRTRTIRVQAVKPDMFFPRGVVETSTATDYVWAPVSVPSQPDGSSGTPTTLTSGSLTSGAYTYSGDLAPSGTLTITDSTVYVRGSLILSGGDHLILENSDIYIGQNLSVGGSAILEFRGGVNIYVQNDVTMNGNMESSGSGGADAPWNTIYVGSDLSLGGSVAAGSTQPDIAFIMDTGDVFISDTGTVGGSVEFHGAIYAPTRNITVQGNVSNISGSIIGSSISFNPSSLETTLSDNYASVETRMRSFSVDQWENWSLFKSWQEVR